MCYNEMSFKTPWYFEFDFALGSYHLFCIAEGKQQQTAWSMGVNVT